MVDYGNPAALVIISTNQNNGVPTGDRFYLLAKSFNKRFRNGNKTIELIQGKNFYINFGKRKQSVNITDAILLSTEVNSFFSFMDRYACTDTPITSYLYLFIKLDSTTYLRFRDSGGAYQNYLYCIPEDYTISADTKDKVIKVSVNFSEVSPL